MKTFFALCPLIFFFSCASHQPAQSDPSRDLASTGGMQTKQILFVTDVHFDSLYDPTIANELFSQPPEKWEVIFRKSKIKELSSYGSDINYPLFKSTLNAMRLAAPKSPIILMGGDLVAHHFETHFKERFPKASHQDFEIYFNKTMQYIALMFQNTFSTSQVVVTLGNNDSPCGDYMSEPHGEYLKIMAEAWKSAVDLENASPDFLNQFTTGGYYSALSTDKSLQKKLRFISINSDLWGRDYHNKCGKSSDTPGNDEMAWLEKQLRDSESLGEKVWLIHHSPAGLSIAASVYAKKDLCVSENLALFYTDENNATYLRLLEKYHNTIAQVFSGHTHMNDFRIYGHGDSAVASLLVPAVSSIFSNNPSFAALSVDKDSLQPKDYSIYSLDLKSAIESKADKNLWKKLSTKTDVDAKNLGASLESLAISESKKEDYQHKYNSAGPQKNFLMNNWEAYRCATSETDFNGFKACYCH